MEQSVELCCELPPAGTPHGLVSLMLKPPNISCADTCVLFGVALIIHLYFAEQTEKVLHFLVSWKYLGEST